MQQEPITELDDAIAVFDAHRRRLFGIAYRMLGTVSDAEDMVQETWIRWQNTDRADIREPAAFLATITTRLSINALQSAHSRRETYIGPWLPEPVNTDDDPALGAEKGEALQYAVLILLEKLTPTERAAYVLREAFNHSYQEIADILRIGEANARQLVTRARKHVSASGDRRARVSGVEQGRLLNAFVAASRTGDLARLENLFVPPRRDRRDH